MHPAANVAFRAGKWPIQTLALITTVVFICYIAVVELKPSALKTSLARSFVVETTTSYSSLNELNAFNVSEYPQFVGAPIILPSNAPNQIKKLIQQYTVNNENLFTSSSSECENGKIVMQKHLYHKMLDELRVFQVGDETYELQSAPSFIAYTRFYYLRIAELMAQASSFDIFVVSTAWVGMYYTMFKLYTELRTLGSRTFLFLAALMSSFLAFGSAYAITLLLNINVPKLTLAQGLPFFVLTVGFNNKFSLARRALGNPERELGAAEAVRDAVAHQFNHYLRESAIMSGALLCAAFITRNTVKGLFGFCILSALILALDLVFLITFFAANVSLKTAMVRVERNEAVRRALQEDGVSKDVASAYADEVLHFSARAKSSKFTHFKWLNGSMRLVLAFAFIGLNWLHIVRFPVSFFVSRSDLSPVNVKDYVGSVTTPCVLSLVPALRFYKAGRVTVYLNHLAAVLKTAAATRAGILALILSIVCNVYLVGLVMHHQGNSLVVIPVQSPTKKREEVVKSAPSKPEQTKTKVEKKPVTDVVPHNGASRSVEECTEIFKAGNAPELSNDELITLSVKGILPLYALEKQLKDTTRAVVVRRAAVSRLSRTQTLEHSELPYADYNYDRVLGACCENVVGYLPLPLGVAGPVIIDGLEYYLPMATTEGVLVASTMRGCKALNAGGGVSTQILADGMTRGPCVTFATASRTAECKLFLDSEEGYKAMETAFNSTSRFARLTGLKVAQAGMFLYIRFRAQTGDAMGMNMISKGTERALQVLAEECGFDDMTIVSVSGNYCTDKKAAAVNWIEGRGKSVVAEAIVPGDKVRSILKTGVDELVELNMAKNLVGSAVAGVMGGFNAHAANLVAAVFLATGQDPAQVVEGSNCMTLMSSVNGDLQISVTMPSLEVGTIGGGTILEPQAAMLNMLGVKGPHISTPGENARMLARIVATAVLAGELSLNSALAAGHLVKSHMAHNRAKPAN